MTKYDSSQSCVVTSMISYDDLTIFKNSEPRAH